MLCSVKCACNSIIKEFWSDFFSCRKEACGDISYPIPKEATLLSPAGLQREMLLSSPLHHFVLLPETRADGAPQSQVNHYVRDLGWMPAPLHNPQREQETLNLT